MNIRSSFIICFIVSIVILSCNNQAGSVRADLELALRLSDTNRTELEKVLKHYSSNPDDSLKLKAAEFLISNMIYHYSFGGSYMDKHIKEVDSLYSHLSPLHRSIAYNIPGRVGSLAHKLDVVFDLHTISSDFLISNIDDSFAIWNRMPDSRKLNFADFCEYILPYRYSTEPLISWKYRSSHYDSIYYKGIGVDTDIAVASYYYVSKLQFDDLVDLKLFSDVSLGDFKPDCIDRAYCSVAINRLMGIPSAVDFIPHHSQGDARHYWEVVISNKYHSGFRSSYKYDDYAKVYRKTYSINPVVEDEKNYVPSFMRDPYIKDVTSLYTKTIDFEYEFSSLPSNVRYGYLAVFNSLSWQEISWSLLDGDKALFRNTGIENLYLPTYYDGREQKLRAARFLIANMTYHYSLGGDWMNSYIHRVDSAYCNIPGVIRAYLYSVPSRLDTCVFTKEYDVRNVSSEFLINNIEYSFSLWENSDYYNKLSFHDFCEYILPYRIDTEPLSSWRDSSLLHDFDFGILDHYDIPLLPLSNYYRNKILGIDNHIDFQHYVKHILREPFRFNTMEDGFFNSFISLAYGIPYSLDYHTTNLSTPKVLHNNVMYSMIDPKLIYGCVNKSYSILQNAKVYRKTYSINSLPVDSVNHIPSFFRNPYFKDVTELYFNTADVSYSFDTLPPGVSIAYLSLYDDVSLNEVSWSEIVSGRGVFRKMSLDNVYIPTYYIGTERHFADYPIMLDVTGKVSLIVPDHDSLQYLKFRYTSRLSEYDYIRGLTGLCVLASNDKINYDTLAVVRSMNDYCIDLPISYGSDFKYWKFVSHKQSTVNAYVADIVFLDSAKRKLPGHPYYLSHGGSPLYNRSMDRQFPNIFDGNGLTDCFVNFGDFSLCYELSASAALSSVSYVRIIGKTDGEVVFIGDEYELLYFNKGRWESLGTKVASDISVEFDNVPSGALFMLRNLSKSTPSRPFTVDSKGYIRFW